MNPELELAYAQTLYRVDAPSPFVLRIGQASAAPRALHQRHAVDCSAFITACNPYSQGLEDADNAARQAELEQVLTAQGRAFLRGIGQHPTNGWPGEPSVLILGLDLESARTLGVQLQQNALVWCGADAVPQLILLR